MIELPTWAKIASINYSLIDKGLNQRAAFGPTTRIDRPGSRHMFAFATPPMQPDQSRVMVARLLAGKSEGLQMSLPLLAPQGSPGSCVVDGAVLTMTKTLPIRGLSPGYMCQEGFWLSIENGDGQHFIHSVQTGGRADAAGDLTVTLTSPLRFPFADGAAVHLARPILQGFVDGDTFAWSASVDRFVALEFTVEEYQ